MAKETSKNSKRTPSSEAAQGTSAPIKRTPSGEATQGTSAPISRTPSSETAQGTSASTSRAPSGEAAPGASASPAPLKRGWTTGACATAATKAALTALLDGDFPDPVTITLPGGQTPAFTLTTSAQGPNWAQASITKDAGDDPDITHGALIEVRVATSATPGLHFHAGAGVGVVTKAGLPIAVGAPSISPVPRQMMTEVVAKRLDLTRQGLDLSISIPDGEALAAQTWNGRLGIVGGLSILGTTGIVVPYSCAAWIHSIHRGIDVARAEGLRHVAAATGNRSEIGIQALYGLPSHALLDMGDFAGALMKYLRAHPIPRLSIAGGLGKISKLAQGHGDLHSARSQVDVDFLRGLSGQDLPEAETAAQAYAAATDPAALVRAIADRAKGQAQARLGPSIEIDVQLFSRMGDHLGGSESGEPLLDESSLDGPALDETALGEPTLGEPTLGEPV